MEVGQLRPRRSASRILAAKVQQQREFLDAQLAELQIYANNKADAAVGAVICAPRTGKRAKPASKYRSKKARTRADLLISESRGFSNQAVSDSRCLLAGGQQAWPNPIPLIFASGW
jgi:hypothetical protein